MKRLVSFILVLLALSAASQNQPIFRQWFAVQGMYNPAMVGANEARDVSLLYRRQWVGSGVGPIGTGFFFQHSGRHRLHYGVSVTTNESVRLRNSDGRFILAYALPLAKKTSLRFGMSFGLATRKLNLADDDFTNDPAVLRAADGIFGMAGSFGISLESGPLQVGFSLPAVLPQENYSPAQLAAVGNSQLLSQWYSVRYRIRSSTGKMELDPWVVYRVLRDQRRNWEVGGLITFNKVFSIGSGLNQGLGPSLSTGYRMKGGVQAGYTWEPGFGTGNSYGASHEMRITIQVGSHSP